MGCSYIAGRNIVQLRSKSLALPQKVNVELPHDTAIPLLDVYSKEPKTGFQTNMCT